MKGNRKEMKMKKILITRPSLPPIEEYIAELRDIWESQWLTNMGPKHNLLENELKEYLGVDRISLFTNGHTALEMCLQAMNLSGEVITTPFTFASTTHAIVRNGLKPVFCDINMDDYLGNWCCSLSDIFFFRICKMLFRISDFFTCK